MKKIIRNFLLFILLYSLVVVPAGLIGGCTSQVLPHALSETQKQSRANGFMDISVGVQTHKYPVYSESLLRSLSLSGIFREVKLLEQFDETPDLIASVEHEIYGSSVLPIFTGLTLGLFPTWTTEEWGESFSLRSARQDAQKSAEVSKHKLHIDYQYKGLTFLGWFSGALNLLSTNRTGDAVKTHPQYVHAFAYRLALQRAEIMALLEHR